MSAPQERERPYAVANGQVVQGDTFIGAVRAADLLNDQAERLAAVEAALREVWFRDDDYEIPGLLSMDYEIAPSDGSQPEWDDPLWAWADHPWLGLLGITEAECHAFFDARNAAARAALGSEAARPEDGT